MLLLWALCVITLVVGIAAVAATEVLRRRGRAIEVRRFMVFTDRMRSINNGLADISDDMAQAMDRLDDTVVQSANRTMSVAAKNNAAGAVAVQDRARQDAATVRAAAYSMAAAFERVRDMALELSYERSDTLESMNRKQAARHRVITSLISNDGLVRLVEKVVAGGYDGGDSYTLYTELYQERVDDFSEADARALDRRVELDMTSVFKLTLEESLVLNLASNPSAMAGAALHRDARPDTVFQQAAAQMSITQGRLMSDIAEMSKRSLAVNTELARVFDAAADKMTTSSATRKSLREVADSYRLLAEAQRDIGAAYTVSQ